MSHDILDEIQKSLLDRLHNPDQPLLSLTSSVVQVQARLQEMFSVDQDTRMSYDKVYDLGLDAAHIALAVEQVSALIMQVDEVYYEELEHYLKNKGWPTISQCGESASLHMWLLVQHADQHIELQKWALEQMEALLESEEVLPRHYAYLYDRVACGENRPQRYGTQGRCVGKDQWEPNELESPHHVDVLREGVGLGTMSEYKMLFVGKCHESDGA